MSRDRNPIRAAWIFDLRTKRNTFAIQANRVLATVGVVVDLAVTVVVFAIADLRGGTHAAHADPTDHPLALEVPCLALAL